MKTKLFTFILLAFALKAMAQSPVVNIEEDYTKPEYYTYKASDEFCSRIVENGMYVSKPGKIPAQLSFPYEIDKRQGTFRSKLDMETVLSLCFTLYYLFLSVVLN
ncbi:MAG: hypothetical protein SFW35_05440 [Chitinophagales bacterium]|nr:hypothetical protein [Chitinophagales bacterium]